MPEIVGERIPETLTDYIDQPLPHYTAVAKTQRNWYGLLFQARYQTEKIVVYGTPQPNLDDAVAMLEMTIDILMNNP